MYEYNRLPYQREKANKAGKEWIKKMKEAGVFNEHERVKKLLWRLNNKDLAVNMYKLQNKKRKYKNFILGIGRKFKNENNGMEYRCYGCIKECMTNTPFEENNLKDFKLFRQLVIKYCDKK